MPGPTPETLKDYMQRRMLLALVCLAALAAGSLWLGWQSYRTHTGGAEMINLCGRQRLLVQRIAAAADGLTEAHDEEQAGFWRRALFAAHREMDVAQAMLLAAVTDPARPVSPALPALFLAPPARLEARARVFLDTALLLAQNSRGAPLEIRLAAPEKQFLLTEAFGPLMVAYEDATTLFQAETEGGNRRLLAVQIAAAAATVALLTLLWAVVFRPMRAGILGLNARLEALAVRDELTGLFNRRKLNEMLAHEVALAHRHGHALSLVIFDLDHFKKVNDTCGHQTGDAVLRESAARAARQVRATDTLARWGGEEFCLVLPHTGLTAAAGVAEKVRCAFADAPFACPQPVTASFGAAELRPDETPERLAARADGALYRAKEQGRNRVEQDA